LKGWRRVVMTALFPQQGHEATGFVGIQPFCRLVSQNEGWIGSQGPGQGHALLFGWGQLTGPTMQPIP